MTEYKGELAIHSISPLVAAIQQPSLIKGPMRDLMWFSRDYDLLSLMKTTRRLYYHDHATLEFSERTYDIRILYEHNPKPHLKKIYIDDTMARLFENVFLRENSPRTIIREDDTPFDDDQPRRYTVCQERLRRVTFLDLTRLYKLDNLVVLISWKFPQLLGLDVSNQHSFSDLMLSCLAFGCRQLQKLSLSCCDDITDEGIRFMSNSCVQLTYLDLSCSNDNITDRSLGYLAQGCKRLIYLDICECHAITETGIAYLSRGLTEMKHLIMSGKQATKKSLTSLGQGCNHLEHLDVQIASYLQSTDVHPLLVSCSTITSLTLSSCYGISDLAFTPLSNLTHACSLRRLSLLLPNDGFTDIGLRTIAFGCPLLTDISIVSCDSITGKGARALLDECPHINTLNLRNCCLVEFVTSLTTPTPSQYPRLINLNVSYCESITDSCVRILLLTCPRLKNLDVEGCAITRDESSPDGIFDMAKARLEIAASPLEN